MDATDRRQMERALHAAQLAANQLTSAISLASVALAELAVISRQLQDVTRDRGTDAPAAPGNWSPVGHLEMAQETATAPKPPTRRPSPPRPTRCKRGHAYDVTAFGADGKPHCRICTHEREETLRRRREQTLWLDPSEPDP
jgi:hypothetical protein